MHAKKRTVANTPYEEALNEMRAECRPGGRLPTAPTRWRREPTKRGRAVGSSASASVRQI